MQDFLEKLEKENGCKIGIFAESFDDQTPKKTYFNETEIFPAASIIKIFVAAATLQKAEKEKWELDKEIEIRVEEKTQKSSVIAETGLERISLEDALYFLLAHSDNLAQNLLEKIISPQEINEFIKKQGFEKTKFISLKKSNEKILSLTTPQDSANFLEKLYQGKIVGKEFTSLLLEKLSQTRDFSAGLRYLPCKLNVANPEIENFHSKTGRLKNTSNSCSILKTKEEVFVISVFITNLEMPELRNGVDNKGSLLAAKITKKVFEELRRK